MGVGVKADSRSVKKGGSEFKAKQCGGKVLLFILFMLDASSGTCAILLVRDSLLPDLSCWCGDYILNDLTLWVTEWVNSPTL